MSDSLVLELIVALSLPSHQLLSTIPNPSLSAPSGSERLRLFTSISTDCQTGRLAYWPNGFLFLAWDTSRHYLTFVTETFQPPTQATPASARHDVS